MDDKLAVNQVETITKVLEWMDKSTEKYMTSKRPLGSPRWVAGGRSWAQPRL